MQSYRLVRGTKDLIKEEAEKFRYIENTAKKLASLYGFSEIITPIFEFASLFIRNVGNNTDIINKEMYLFEDRGGEKLALRPEGTASVVRAILSNSLTHLLPLKFSYFGPMFRYERPQIGRQRQFYQFGVEHLGANSIFHDFEIISLGNKLLQQLGITNYSLLINNLGSAENRIQYKKVLLAYLKKYQNELSEDSKERIHTNPLRILDSKDSKDKDIIKEVPSLLSFLEEKDLADFEILQKYLTDLKVPFKIDDKLVRGLDYYNNIVFEFINIDLGTQNTLLAGGRYDSLIQNMGGPPTKAVGFATGIERLILSTGSFSAITSKIAILTTDVQFNFYAYSLAEKLRKHKIITEMILGDNLSKQFKQANKQRAVFAVIIGENEYSNNYLTIKNLNTFSESIIKETELLSFFQKELN